MAKVWAPFTPDQVASINAYQAADMFHPFTCPDDDCRSAPESRYAPMVATTGNLNGMTCPHCGRMQMWVHSSMADWSWQRRGTAAREFLDGAPMIEVPGP